MGTEVWTTKISAVCSNANRAYFSKYGKLPDRSRSGPFHRYADFRAAKSHRSCTDDNCDCWCHEGA